MKDEEHVHVEVAEVPVRSYIDYGQDSKPLETEMLDAFIIDRIRQRQNQSREAQVPLRIEVPVPEPKDPRREERKEEEPRGVVIVDFTI
jgi:hypothetical protein